MKLQRYNEILMALLGTAALALMAFWGVSALWPNHREPPGVRVEPPEPGVTALQQVLEFCEPTISGDGAQVYIPVAVLNRSDADRDSSFGAPRQYAIKAVSASRYDDPGCHGAAASRVSNVVIQDSATGEQRLLLSRPGLVGSIIVPDKDCRQGQGPVPCGVALWMLQTDDSNGDGRLAADDAASAWASDLAGRGLRRISPEGASVEGHIWVPTSNQLALRVRPDSNGDGRFTLEDGTRWLATSASQAAMVGEAIHTPILEELQKSAQVEGRADARD